MGRGAEDGRERRKGFTLILNPIFSPVSPTAVTNASLAARADTPSIVKLSPYKKREKVKKEVDKVVERLAVNER